METSIVANHNRYVIHILISTYSILSPGTSIQESTQMNRTYPIPVTVASI